MMDDLNRVPLELDRVPLEAETAPDPRTKGADPFAVAVMAVRGLPPSEYPRLVKQFQLTGNMKLIEDAEATYRSTNDAKAGAKIGEYLQKKAAELGYDPTISLLAQGDVRERVTRATEELAAANNVALDHAIIEGLASGPMPFDATPEEREDAAIVAADPAVGAENIRQNDELLYESILEDAKKNGISGSLGESLAGSVSSMFVAPDVIAFRAIANEFNLNLSELESWSVGTVIEAVQKRRAAITSPEAQREFDLKFVGFLMNSPAIAFDATALKVINSVYSSDGTDALSDPNRSMFYTNMIWQMLDVAGAASLGVPKLKPRVGAMRMSPELRKMAEVSPSKFEATLKEALSNPKATELVNALGGAEEVALSQMPKAAFITEEGKQAVEKLDPNLGLIPDVLEAELQTEAARIADISADLERSANTAYTNALTPEAKAAAIAREKDAFDAAVAGTHRPSLSRITLNPDGSTTFDTVLGASKRKGYSPKAAVDLAVSYQEKGFNTRLFTIVKGKRVYINETNMELFSKPVLDKLKKPTYFVEVSQRYTFDPKDMAAFGDEVVNGWAMLGRAADLVGVPSAWLQRNIYKRYVANELLDSAMVSKMESIITPVRRLPRATQTKLNEILEWAEVFADTNKKAANLSDMVAKFGNQLTPDLVRGYWTMRNYFDVAYILANKRAYNFLGGKQGRSLVNTDTGFMYHGSYLKYGDDAHVADLSRAKQGVYNPNTNSIQKLSDKQLKDLYDGGGQILKSPLSEEVGNKVTNFIMWDGKAMPKWKAQPLNRYVLEYNLEYRPLIYEGKTFIYKVWDASTKNGMVTPHRKAMYAVGSKSEADRVVQTLPPGDGFRWEIGDNAALSEMDRNLADMEVLRHQDSRLMYGPRGKRLRGADGVHAAILDPINAAMVQAHRISRQISMEDLTSYMFSGWAAEFKDVIQEMVNRNAISKDITISDYRVVTDALKDRVVNGGKRELEAYMSWQYIHSMRGITSQSSTIVRTIMTRIGESYYNLAKRTGLLKSTADKGRDRIANFSPFEFAKTVSYIDYIKGNPARQLLVQGMQPMFLMPVAAKVYRGNIPRWVQDAGNIILGSRRIGMEQGLGKKVTEEAMKKAAKQMGMTLEDYTFFISKVENMGILQRINPKNWADDFVTTETVLPTTKAGRVAQAAGAPIKGAIDAMGVGFNVGERWNVSHSLALAYREYMAKNGLKSPKMVTQEGWLDITANAVDYSGGMVRANRAAWQKNVVLGTALQYMQFVHKSTLTMFGANTNAFSRKTALAITGHQLLGFGFKGVPMLGYIPDVLEDMGIVGDPEIADTLRWGMYDLLFDEFAQLATNDPDADYAATEFFAPGAGTVNTAVEMYRQVAEGPIGPWLGGAPWKSLDGIWQGVKLAWDIGTMDEGTEWDDETWMYVGSALLDGTFAGFSQLNQGMLALQYMRYATKNGNLANVAVSNEAAIIRAITGGMRTQEEVDFWEAQEELSTIRNIELLEGNTTGTDADAKEYYDRVQRVLIATGQGQMKTDEARILILKMRKLFENKDPAYAQRFRERLWALSQEDEDSDKDLGTLIDKAMTRGMTIPQRIINNIMSSKTLTEENKVALVQRIEIWQKELKDSVAIIKDTMKIESEYYGVKE